MSYVQHGGNIQLESFHRRSVFSCFYVAAQFFPQQIIPTYRKMFITNRFEYEFAEGDAPSEDQPPFKLRTCPAMVWISPTEGKLNNSEYRYTSGIVCLIPVSKDLPVLNNPHLLHPTRMSPGQMVEVGKYIREVGERNILEDKHVRNLFSCILVYLSVKAWSGLTVRPIPKSDMSGMTPRS